MARHSQADVALLRLSEEQIVALFRLMQLQGVSSLLDRRRQLVLDISEGLLSIPASEFECALPPACGVSCAAPPAPEQPPITIPDPQPNAPPPDFSSCQFEPDDGLRPEFGLARYAPRIAVLHPEFNKAQRALLWGVFFAEHRGAFALARSRIDAAGGGTSCVLPISLEDRTGISTRAFSDPAFRAALSASGVVALGAPFGDYVGRWPAALENDFLSLDPLHTLFQNVMEFQAAGGLRHFSFGPSNQNLRLSPLHVAWSNAHGGNLVARPGWPEEWDELLVRYYGPGAVDSTQANDDQLDLELTIALGYLTTPPSDGGRDSAISWLHDHQTGGSVELAANYFDQKVSQGVALFNAKGGMQ